MPQVKLHYGNGEVYEQEVKENSNLVVLAGIRKFPHLKYGCGMGKCTKCKVQILNGAEHLAPPNWKEEKMLNEKLQEGYRLCCQLYIQDDIEMKQD
jgi:ferredoxin